MTKHNNKVTTTAALRINFQDDIYKNTKPQQLLGDVLTLLYTICKIQKWYL